jgi:Amt family ammonium transporter
VKASAQWKTFIVGLAGVLPLMSGLGVEHAWAENAPLKADSGDTAWVLVSSAFVLAMLMPGLALFYGGLVRTKNVLGTIMQSIMILGVVSLLWILFGYSLAFGSASTGWAARRTLSTARRFRIRLLCCFN